MVKETLFLCVVIISSYVVQVLKAKESKALLRRRPVSVSPSHPDSTTISEIPLTLSTSTDSNLNCILNKHEEFCKCRQKGLVAYESGEYVIQNGTAYILSLNASYGPLFYELQNGDLLICTPNYKKPPSRKDSHGQHPDAYAYITLIGLIASIVCLTLHLIAFVLVPDLRNIPGCCTVCLSASLLSGYISFLVGFDERIQTSRVPCIAVAFSTHFFLFSSVLWMNAMSFDIFKSLINATRQLVVISSSVTFKNFYVYCLYAWGIALGFAIAAVVSDNTPDFPEQYKPHFGQGMCWFQQPKALLLFFAAPAFILICMNAVFFGMSVYIIVTNSMKSADPNRNMLKRNLILYSRLAVIMGLSWLSSLLASVTNVEAFRYISSVLNTFQGFFIFLAFTCTPKVKNYFKILLGLDSGKHSVQTCSQEKSSENSKKTMVEEAPE